MTPASPAVVVDALECRTLFTVTTFTLDPDLSTLTLSGDIANSYTAEGQRPDSLMASYEGSIVADVSAGGLVTFVGGSDIEAQTAGRYDPGTASANYAVTGETGGLFSVKSGEAAVRGLKFDLTTSGAVSPAGEDGTFDPAALTFHTTAGTLAYTANFSKTVHTDGLSGKSLANSNTSGDSASLFDDPDLEEWTLTIPVDVTIHDGTSDLRLTGQLVATTESLNNGTDDGDADTDGDGDIDDDDLDNSGDPDDDGGWDGDVNTVRIGEGGDAKAVQFLDEDGTLTTMTVRGGGAADVSFLHADDQDAGPKGSLMVRGDGLTLIGIDAFGTTVRSKVSVTTKGGADGLVEVPNADVDGDVGTLGGKGVNFNGDVSVAGTVGTLLAGELNDVSINADSIGSLKVIGDMSDSDVTTESPLDPNAFAIGKVTIGGDMDSSAIEVDGNIGNIKSRSISLSCFDAGVESMSDEFPTTNDVSALASIGSVTTGSFADSVIAGHFVGKLKLGAIATLSGSGDAFGITADTMAGLQATDEIGNPVKLGFQDDPAALADALSQQPFSSGNFAIRLA